MRRNSSSECFPDTPTARIRFHGELVDLLRRELRVQPVELRIAPGATVKHAIETLDVPHTEFGEIEVDGKAAEPGRLLAAGESIEVFPARAGSDPTDGEARFLADAHLGALARLLRLLGFDTALAGDDADNELAERAQTELRIVLSRDRELLKHRRVLRGRLIRSLDPEDQVVEVLRRFGSEGALRPFTRCLECNSPLRPVGRALVEDRLPPSVAASHCEFKQCSGCGRVYWPGSHWNRLRARVDAIARRLE
jgi:uncharacterized protein with PIN domain